MIVIIIWLVNQYTVFIWLELEIADAFSIPLYKCNQAYKFFNSLILDDRITR